MANQEKNKSSRKNNIGIWFLTSIRIKGNAFDDIRTFGYYNNFSDAIKAVQENRGNMYEFLYNYLVMEKIGQGIHASTIEEQWFKWNGKKWITCQKPNELTGLTNWAIG